MTDAVVTEGMEAELELKDKVTTLRTITDMARDAIIMIDCGGLVTFWNPAAEKIFGFTAEDIMGRELHLFVMPERRHNAYRKGMACFRKRGNGPAVGVTVELDALRKGGEEFSAEISLSSAKIGGRWYATAIARDITERKKMEERLKEVHLELEKYAISLDNEKTVAEHARLLAEAANRARSEFLANMSHELRTPLNAIIGFADVLKDGLGGKLSPKQERYVENIRTSSRHLHGMIEDMLDLAQMEAGTVELQVIPFLLRDVLTGALSRFSEKSAFRGISISLKVEPEVEGEIRSDPVKLKQILHDLLSNAVKFTPDEGSVRVVARLVNDVGAIHELHLPHDGDFIEISVEDSGIGIGAEHIPRIFEGLIQLESPYSKTYGGAGLGLVLTKKLVERLGGIIRVKSEVGRGSTFCVLLPMQRRQSGTAAEGRGQ